MRMIVAAFIICDDHSQKLNLEVWWWEGEWWIFKILISINFQRREMTITLTMRMRIANLQNPNLNKFSAKGDDNNIDDENDRGSLSHLWWSFSKLKLKVWRWEWQFRIYTIFIFFNFQRREMTITRTMRMIVAAFLICHSLKLGLNCYEIATNFMGILHFNT